MEAVEAPTAGFVSGQRSLMERIAMGAPTRELLADLIRLVEAQAAGMFCSILVLDDAGTCIEDGVGPRLPPAYLQAFKGLKIGPNAGSCGAAAYRRERVIVEDIDTHPNWAAYKHLALPFNLHACWSTPIFSPGGDVLGTYAMYYDEPRGPSRAEIVWVDAATHVASIALQRARVQRDTVKLLASIERAAASIRQALASDDPQHRNVQEILSACARAAELNRV